MSMIFDLSALRHICSCALQKGGSFGCELAAARFLGNVGRKLAMKNLMAFSQWKAANYDVFESLLTPLEKNLAKKEGLSFSQYFELYLETEPSNGAGLIRRPPKKGGLQLDSDKPFHAHPITAHAHIGPTPIPCRIVRSEDGLSWMEIAFCDLVKLGIQRKISKMSLYNKGYAYLSPVDQYFLDTAAENSGVELSVLDPEDLYRNVPGFPPMDGRKPAYPDISAFPRYVLEEIQEQTNDSDGIAAN